MTTLEEIVAYTHTLVEQRQADTPRLQLESLIACRPHPLDFAAALDRRSIALIAEVKQASPSRGLIRPDMDHAAVAETYARGGAAAISVLTEPRSFRGSLAHLSDIAASPVAHSVPLVRKDFIIDPYQIYEARAYGADAILLIVAILDPDLLQSLLLLTGELGMHCLVEAHNAEEVDVAVSSGARIVGINNRDLHSFKVDLSTFERLRPRIPEERLVVAESGIRGPAEIRRLAAARANAVLVGETLTAADDIGARTRELACAI